MKAQRKTHRGSTDLKDGGDVSLARPEDATAVETGTAATSVVGSAVHNEEQLPIGMELGMEELLPVELVQLVLRYTHPLTWPCCRLVCHRWKAILDGMGVDYQYDPKEYLRLVALQGWLSVLKWARANGCSWDVWVCAHAAGGGHLEVLQWVRSNGCPWHAWTCAYAAERGHLDVLQWARANGCPWNAWTCAKAAEGGHLDVLQWSRANGCPWNAKTCAHAAGGGHLEVLQWARAKGCPWDKTTCSYAAEGGHLEVLQWASSNGCPWGQLNISPRGGIWNIWTSSRAQSAKNLHNQF
jgi:hypothetical protein